MGEARRRGTFEQRKIASIKRAEDLKKKKLAETDMKPTTTFESRESQRRTAQLLSMMIAIEGKEILVYKI